MRNILSSYFQLVVIKFIYLYVFRICDDVQQVCYIKFFRRGVTGAIVDP